MWLVGSPLLVSPLQLKRHHGSKTTSFISSLRWARAQHQKASSRFHHKTTNRPAGGGTCRPRPAGRTGSRRRSVAQAGGGTGRAGGATERNGQPRPEPLPHPRRALGDTLRENCGFLGPAAPGPRKKSVSTRMWKAAYGRVFKIRGRGVPPPIAGPPGGDHPKLSGRVKAFPKNFQRFTSKPIPGPLAREPPPPFRSRDQPTFPPLPRGSWVPGF